jgi:ribosomal protein S18 acetylase RimI-like enzyme
MSGVVVRRATPADAAGCVAVIAEVAAERRYIATVPEEVRTVEQQAARLADPSVVPFVAEDAGRIVAIATLHPDQRPARKHVAELGITVAPSHRGRGLGRRLMLEMEAWARANGIEKMCLGVFADNERARRLYRSLGYQEEGMRRGQYRLGGGEPKDEVLMTKWLR